MNSLVWIPLTLLLVLSCPGQPLPTVVMPDAKTEAAVHCSEELYLASIELTPYGFAKGSLASLWFARNAAETAKGIRQATDEADNMFTFSIALMRITKTGTNDFICAKRAVKPFALSNAKGETNGYMRTASEFLSEVYDSHININMRCIEVIKRLAKASDLTDFSDQISTLQVERDQRWADLVRPTSLALMLLVAADDKGTTSRVSITKAQKKTLLDWANEHFPEFKDGTPKDKWSDPARTAQLFFKLFETRKCSDE
jgi:hypothetical protein